jgi:HK97 family phage portal protein
MGLLARLFGRSETKADDARGTAYQQWLVDWFRGGEPTTSGIAVNPETALKYAAVWACVRIVSEDVAKLPLILYRRKKDGGKERAVDHPLYRILHDRPNARMTSFEWREASQAQVELRGNAFSFIERDARGRVVNLWPLQGVTVMEAADGDLLYRLHNQTVVPAEMILHQRGLTLDGKMGLSTVGYHRETIGLGMAAERYGAAFFGNNAQPKGALVMPNLLGAEAAKTLRADWERKHRGADKAHTLAILDGGMKFEQMGMDHTDAQYIELRSFQLGDIARCWRVPPHKIADLTRATFSNIEHQALEYVSDSLLPRARRSEQTYERDLLSDAERGEYFIEHLLDGLLRGDMASRYAAYATARNWGWLSVNDIRRMENMDPLPDGDEYLRPLNMVPAGTPAPLPKPAPTDPAVTGE